MARFVRVVHRHGWVVEIIGDAGAAPETASCGSRQEALDHAITLEPDWIEIGEIVGLDTPQQHHEWTALRRQRDGSYATSALRWQRPSDQDDV